MFNLSLHKVPVKPAQLELNLFTFSSSIELNNLVIYKAVSCVTASIQLTSLIIINDLWH